MGTEQLINMFNKDDENSKKSSSQNKTEVSNLPGTSSYQKIIDNISEIWDESQYENEFNVSNFIDSLKK